MDSRRSVTIRRIRQSAVLIDGSCLYLAARSLYEGRQLDYHGLVDLLVDRIAGLSKPGETAALWCMWTAASVQNEGQSRFLEFAERDLRWEVRRVPPGDSYVVDPSLVLGLSSDNRSASRLVRFDASIAFAIGRLAEQRSPLVVISDSFALADPLRRAARLSPDIRLAFFGTALDSRWQGVLRREDFVDLIDLDEHDDRLFGIARSPPAKRSDDGKLVY